MQRPRPPATWRDWAILGTILFLVAVVPPVTWLLFSFSADSLVRAGDPPTPTASAEEALLRAAIAEQLGVDDDWGVIWRTLNTDVFELGMARADAPAQLAALGPVSRTDAETVDDGRACIEAWTFDNPTLAARLGARYFVFDAPCDSDGGVLTGLAAISPTSGNPIPILGGN